MRARGTGSRALLLLTPVLLCICTIAHGQAPPPPAASPSDDSAKRHFLLGVQLYNEGNFAGAIVEFKASYKERPVAAPLFNLARAHEALFQYAEAVDAMERYLREGGAAIPNELRLQAEELLVRCRPRLATLVIISDAPDARVSIDGRSLGSTGSSARVGSGTHAVEVTAPGHEPERRTVEIAAGDTQQLTFHLRRISTVGRLRVDAVPSSASVFVDGVNRGPPPFDGDLAAGAHKVEVRSVGYRDHVDAVNLGVGEQRTLAVTLEKLPAEAAAPWYKKWYFWTGVVVAVGGGVTAAVLATRGPPDPILGSLDPGVQQVGLWAF